MDSGDGAGDCCSQAEEERDSENLSRGYWQNVCIIEYELHIHSYKNICQNLKVVVDNK